MVGRRRQAEQSVQGVSALDRSSTAPALIIAFTNNLVLDFKAATTTIPIVGMFAVPVEAGIVASLARPGGNITGASIDVGESSGASGFNCCAGGAAGHQIWVPPIASSTEVGAKRAIAWDGSYVGWPTARSYGIDFAALGHRVADIVDEILKGAKPSDIPLFQPTKFERPSISRQRTAGLTVPGSSAPRTLHGGMCAFDQPHHTIGARGPNVAGGGRSSWDDPLPACQSQSAKSDFPQNMAMWGILELAAKFH